MIATALTEMFGLQHPIILGPMGGVSGGHLAATVSNAGGLGSGDASQRRTIQAIVIQGLQKDHEVSGGYNMYVIYCIDGQVRVRLICIAHIVLM